MASSAACLHAASSIQAQGFKGSSTGLPNKVGVLPLRMVLKGFSLDMPLLARRGKFPPRLNLHVVRALSSQSSIADPIEVPSNSNSADSQKKSSKKCFFFVRTLLLTAVVIYLSAL